ncbi:hypothetical protein [Sphingorhabdus sp. YGSMI21]|uniref:hypothetical protein n=1 Tax=Sphingorhabdus sp. YGSMI21 TaxID=2077182 RepID=UPI000C1E8047|nr:hypothetical protein [Sphingorhabdus sp. YGSMI21]ATW03593.1 hypothetical protein CHN51_08635 [Sphingorhabdus sp. YGSMI21]
MKAFYAAFFAIALSLGSFSAPAIANNASMQVDWSIVKGNWPKIQSVSGKTKVDLSVEMHPTRLLVAERDIVGVDGRKLLPAGSQLYGMAGKTTALCSQSPASELYMGSKSRVCLIDKDNDGVVDHSFLAGFGKNWLAKRPGWWILNQADEDEIFPIILPSLAEINPLNATQTLSLKLALKAKRSGGIVTGVYVDGLDAGLFGICQPLEKRGSDLISSCFVEGFTVTFHNYKSKDKSERRLDFDFPDRKVSILMEVSKGLIGSEVASLIFY